MQISICIYNINTKKLLIVGYNLCLWLKSILILEHFGYFVGNCTTVKSKIVAQSDKKGLI